MSLLRQMLDAIAAGRFTPPDGTVSVLPAPSVRDAGVLAVTGHAVVFADVPAAWARARLPDGDLSAPLNPPFLAALCRRTGRRVSSLDLLLVADRRPGPPPVPLTERPDADHPRLARAHRYRDDVRAYAVEGGLLLLGHGVAGRT